jgi:fatty acid omega-hydroxylase
MKYENRANPYPFFDELRKTPVARVTNGIYAVSGFDEIITLTHDPRVSSDLRNRAQAPAQSGNKSEETSSVMEKYGKDPMMITADPPDHDRARRQAMRHFGPPHSPDLIPGMEPECQRIVNDLLDKARGKTRIDFVDEYAYRLPVTIICQILGVPLKDEPLFHDWIADLMAGADMGPEAATPEAGRLREKAAESRLALAKYIIGLVQSAEKAPGSGMISKLVHDDGPDGRMSDSEIVANTILLLIAGHDSTVNLISHTILTLLRHPGSIELLRRRPNLVPGAIEEALRLQSSVQFFPSRTALADIEIGGTTIPKGSPIFLLYGAANRDPRRFSEPNKFDPERKDNQHLGWGGGVHVCFGGPLARLEVNTAIEAFLRRVANPRLVVDPPPYRPSQIFRGPRHLLLDVDGIRD